MARDPALVPWSLIDSPAALAKLANALGTAQHVAIDTEVPIDGPKKHELRVMSVATRDEAGQELAFVVDARDVDPTLLAPLLTGVTACAWNANFDARVVDAAVWRTDDTTPHLTWWDAQIADALLYQGRTGFGWFHGLAWAAEHYLGVIATGKGTVQLSYTAYDDLSAEQIAYAAADAVETLWVSDQIRSAVREAGLERICAIEMRARPFLDRMERSGLPFDWSGWKSELTDIEHRHRQAVGRLAELTGGGQGTLFDEVVEPQWNPASDRQVRKALNRWSTSEVHAWTAAYRGKTRELTDDDSVTAMVLREIGGPLCEALLEFRNGAKILSTYGEGIADHLHDDGRLRPQYLQVVGTNTGRLASRNPNAQNFTPLMKPYLRPSSAERVFVHADLSQAELRFLAQVSDDTALRRAFADGVDVHVSTAASMFGVDPSALEVDDPARFKELRQIAKALNFGIAYGTGAKALARSLTANGTPTTADEGRGLLRQYLETYPGTAKWAAERIEEIDRVRNRVPGIDWDRTLTLARSFAPVASIRRAFRQERNRWPSADEVCRELLDTGFDIGRDVDHVQWVMQHTAAVALVGDGTPFTFASRTLAGRRQQFNLHVDRLFLEAAIDAIRNGVESLIEVRQRFADEHDVVLYRRGDPLSDQELTRIFEERSLRRRYIEAIASMCGEQVAFGFLTRAAKSRVGAMVNAWRNAPIQGGVADIMLDAFSELDEAMRSFPSARPVQTVHDSVVIECDRTDAEPLAKVVAAALDRASSRWCPDVTPKTDVDIRRSLADHDVIDQQAGVPESGSAPSVEAERAQAKLFG